MPHNRLRNDDVDLLRSPGEQAVKRMKEQVEWTVGQLDQSRLKPMTRWLHRRGITRKQLGELDV